LAPGCLREKTERVGRVEKNRVNVLTRGKATHAAKRWGIMIKRATKQGFTDTVTPYPQTEKEKIEHVGGVVVGQLGQNGEGPKTTKPDETELRKSHPAQVGGAVPRKKGQWGDPLQGKRPNEKREAGSRIGGGGNAQGGRPGDVGGDGE